MNFKGAAKRIDDIDLPRIGARIGVGEDEIHAIWDVEAGGRRGFDSQGRPKMLFEPHVFYRELGKGEKRDKAVKQGLAYPRWRRDYPNDSYPRLKKAMQIDKENALRSASWGLGQVMGFNHMAAGYASAESMVVDFMADEEHQLDAMVSFIIQNDLDDELRRHDWKGFARGYNGKGFSHNRYDTKLAAAYAKWQKIKDTPFDPEDTPLAPKQPPATPEALEVVETPAQSPKPRSGVKGRATITALILALLVGAGVALSGFTCSVLPWLAEFIGLTCGS